MLKKAKVEYQSFKPPNISISLRNPASLKLWNKDLNKPLNIAVEYGII